MGRSRMIVNSRQFVRDPDADLVLSSFRSVPAPSYLQSGLHR